MDLLWQQLEETPLLVFLSEATTEQAQQVQVSLATRATNIWYSKQTVTGTLWLHSDRNTNR
jgi:hypothetical protein